MLCVMAAEYNCVIIKNKANKCVAKNYFVNIITIKK